MKVIFIYVILMFTVLFSQTVTWKTQIPFESESDGPVGIDVDSNGDIFIACFTNGPNISVWTADTLIHSPYTKIIKLDPDGNIIENRNYGVLFKNAVQGIGLTETGYKLIGNSRSAVYHDVLGYYCMSSVWIINNSEGEIIDTLTYNCDDQFEYNAGLTTSQNHQPILKLTHSDTYPGGGSTCYLFDMDEKCLYQPDSIIFPDSLDYIPTVYEHINDFDLTENDVITCGDFFGNMFEGYAYLMKTNDFNTLWEVYEKIEEFGYASVIFCKVAADLDGDIFVNLWIDQNGNNDQEENEYFVRKYTSAGAELFTSNVFSNYFEWLYNIGENQFIAKEYGSNTVLKFTDTGTGVNIDWEYVLDNAHIIRSLGNSFITAGIEGTNIVIQKIDTTTGIELNRILPESSLLYQNYPNPFNPLTEIEYFLENSGFVKMSVYNSQGQFVKDIANSKMEKGVHKVNFNAEDLNSGVYYYQLSVDGVEQGAKKMLYLR